MALALQLVVVGPIAELAVILHVQMAARIVLALRGGCATCKTAQTASQGVVHSTADGPVLACALWRVVAALSSELVANHHLQTAARTVKARQLRCVTHKLVQAALQLTVYWMGDGPILVRALKLVTEGFRAEIAAILRLPMAARIV